jgi:hypothetical protein
MSWTVKNAVEKLKVIQERSATKGGNSHIQEVIDMLDSPDILLIEWGVEDLIIRATDLQDLGGEQKIPTIEQAREMLQTLDRTHDCNYGITWEHLDSVLQDI